MKKKLVCILILTSFMLSGCFNYRDINKVLFVTTIIVDIDENNNPIMYTEAFKPYRSTISGSEKGEKLIYKGSAKTMFEAIRDITLSTSFRLNITQYKAIIFTKRAAEYGLSDFLDFIDRDQEFNLKPYIAIYDGEVDDLLKLNLKSEEYIGIFLTSLMQNVETSSRAVKITMDEFLNDRVSKSKASVITLLKITKDQVDDVIGIDGGAIIKEDKMVDVIPKQYIQGYNFIDDKVKLGTLEVTNPDNKDKFVSLEVLKSNTKTKLYYDGDKIHLKKIIKVKTNLGEVQQGLELNEKKIQLLENRAEENIIDSCERIFQIYQNRNIDIFHIEDEFYRRYPRKKINNVFQKAHLDMDVKVIIDGSSDKTNFQ